MRDKGSNFLRNDVTRNPFVWGALGVCIILIMAAVYVPVFAQVLRVLHPGKEGWMVIVVMSLIPLIIGQILRPLTSHTRNSHSVSKWVRI
jgi:Ca2+-transporting ATPase